MTKVVDPVCGMSIEPPSAAARRGFEGKTYYFCSDSCKRSFDADPRQFSGSAKESATPAKPFEPERHEPPHTTTGKRFTAPKFGSAGSGGAEYEPLPEAHEEDRE